jgi:hypothetical protein
MREHRLQYGQGAQTIRTVAVSELGFAVKPTAATLQLVDLRYSDTDANYSVSAAAAATIDAVSTTTTAVAGRSSSDAAKVALTLTSVAGVSAGRRYLLTNLVGQSEIVTVVSVAAGPKTVQPLNEPQYGYPIGSTFTGLEISGSVAADVANTDDYFDASLAAIWTFTGVEPARVMDRVELVRPQPSWATQDDMVRLEPGLTTRNCDLVSALAQAHFDYSLDLRGAGLNPYTYSGGELARGAVVFLACYHVLKIRDEDAAASEQPGTTTATKNSACSSSWVGTRSASQRRTRRPALPSLPMSGPCSRAGEHDAGDDHQGPTRRVRDRHPRHHAAVPVPVVADLAPHAAGARHGDRGRGPPQLLPSARAGPGQR